MATEVTSGVLGSNSVGSSELSSEAVSGQTDVTMAATDILLFGDTSDSNNLKKGSVQDIIDLIPSAATSRVLLQEQTASSSAQIDFVNGTGGAILDNTYKKYEIDIFDLIPASDGTNLQMLTSSDTGSTFDTGATNYGYVQKGLNSATGDLDAGDPTTSYIPISPATTSSCGSASKESLSGSVAIWNPSNANVYTLVRSEVAMIDSAGNLVVVATTGTRSNSAGIIDAVRFKMDSGNISSAVFKLYGIA